MKSHLILFFLFIVLLSCKDDDEKFSIIGTWDGDRSEVEVMYGFIPVFEETDEEFDVTLEFREDGSVALTRDGDTTEGTYTLSGKKLTTDVDLQIYETSGTVTFDVIELSAKKLRLRLSEKRQANLPDYGNVELTINANLDFDRL